MTGLLVRRAAYFFEIMMEEDSARWQIREMIESREVTVKVNKVKSISKAEKLINRMRRFTESEKDSILQGLSELDVSMYLEEIAAAICDISVIKPRDVPSLANICGHLFTIYGSDFESELHKALKKSQADCVPIKQRLLTRLAVELSLCHILDNLESSIVSWITDWMDQVPNITRYVTTRRAATSSLNVSLEAQILSWAELQHISSITAILQLYSWQLFGLRPAQESGEEEPKCNFSNESRKILKNVIERYVRQKSVVFYLLTHEALHELEILNQNQRLQKVVIDNENDNKFAVLQQLQERVSSDLQFIYDLVYQESPRKLDFVLIMTQLSHMINGKPSETAYLPRENFPRFLLEDMATICPELHGRYIVTNMNNSITRCLSVQDSEIRLLDSRNSEGRVTREEIELEVRWADPGERVFYGELPNLASLVPAVLLGSKSKGCTEIDKSSTDIDKGAEIDKELDKGVTELVVTEAGALDASPQMSLPPRGQVYIIPLDKFIDSFMHFANTCGLIDGAAAANVDGYVRDFFLQQLNGKSNRKRVVRAFLATKRSDLHVLPPICRFVAILSDFYPEVLTSIVSGVLSEWRNLVDEKSPYKIEQKVKVSRFVGELCKMKLMAVGCVLDLINNLVDDFSPHHVEMFCHILETCGRFIVSNRGADLRLSHILAKVKRMRVPKTVPSRLEVFLDDQIVLLQAACQRMNGEMPKIWARQVKGYFTETKPPMKLFIQFLIWHGGEDALGNRLGKGNPRELVRELRRLDWHDNDVVRWISETFLSLCCNVEIDGLSRVSMCLAYLAKYQPQFVISCVDSLLERMVLGLEENETSQRQRRLLESRFLAELFTDKVIDSFILMDFLYFYLGISPTLFASSHFLMPFRAVSDCRAECSHLFNLDDVVQDFPLDVVLGLIKLSSSMGLENRLCDVLCTVNILRYDREGSDLFRVRLICYVLKSCWRLIAKRTSLWRLEGILKFLRYSIAWKSSSPPEGSLFLDIEFCLRDLLNEINPRYSNENLVDKTQASITLAKYLEEYTISLVEKLAQSSPPPVTLITKFYSKFLDTENQQPVKQDYDDTGPGDGDDEAEECDDIAESDIGYDLTTNSVRDSNGNPVEDGVDDIEFDEEEEHDGRHSMVNQLIIINLFQTELQFDKDLEAVICDSIEAARTASSQFPSRSIADLRLPQHLLRGRVNRITTRGNASLDDDSLSVNDDSPGVRFTLVAKKASGTGKFSMKNLTVSANSKLGAALTKSTVGSNDGSVRNHDIILILISTIE